MSYSEQPALGQEAASLAEQARTLADRTLAEEAADQVPGEALQQLMTAAVRLYVARLEAQPNLSPFIEENITATEVAVTVTKMLKAVEMEVFELGMWQVWGNS